jgi:hypothetical protein
MPAFCQIPLPPAGAIVINCRLRDAPYSRGKVFVDGRKIGECPEAIIEVPTGVHSVRAGEALGNGRYLVYQNERVEVGKNSKQLIVARLAPATTENAAGLAYAFGATQLDINRLDRPDDSKTGALSPDGKILAIGAETNSIRLYDASNGNPLRRLGEAGAYWVSFVNKLSFSGDGSLLASSGWQYEKYIGEINIWNIATGRRERTIPNVKEVFSLAFSPDGNLLAAGVGVNELKVWSLSTGELLWSVHPPGEPNKQISQLMFSADGKVVVAGPNRGEDICVYEVRTAAQLSKLRGNLVMLGKGGDVFTFSYRGHDQTLQRTWRLLSGELVDTQLLKTSAVRIMNEQTVLTASKTASILDWRNERLMQALEHPAQIVLTPDRKRLLFYHNGEPIRSFPTSPHSDGEPDTGEIPTVDFCEMVKNPKLYFDKRVRIRAKFTMAEEAAYLSDDKCPLSHDRQIGVGHPEVRDDRQRDLINDEIRKISTREYAGRAIITIGGMLRNSSRRDFAWYQYRFDILSVENVSPVILPYERELQAGVTYSAAVRGDQDSGLALVPPPRINLHHAMRIEWTNVGEFPELEKLRHGSLQQQILFTVLSDEIRQMTASRWNRTLTCKIIRVEQPSN